MVPWNRKLEEHGDLAACACLDCLDKLGLHALFMIADYANAVLRRAHVNGGPPPQVGEHWARRFWNDTLSILCANNQSKRSTERKHKTLISFSGGFMSSREPAVSTEYNTAIFTASTDPGSVLALERTSELLRVLPIASSPSAVIPIKRQLPLLKLQVVMVMRSNKVSGTTGPVIARSDYSISIRIF